jgi:hypothetical protein
MKQDVEFQCTGCRQWLEAPADMAGLVVECPKCAAVIKVPSASETVPSAPSTGRRSPAPPPQEKPLNQDEMKGSTIRIDLPPNLGIPAAPRRRFVIRRKT